MTVFVTSKKKEVLNFNLVSETQPKNQHSNLSVRSQKFFRMYKSKKKEVPKFVSRLFHILTQQVSSVLANTHTKIWAGRNTHERLGTSFQSVASKPLKLRHVLTYRLKQAKDAKQQETCCFSTQTNFELRTRSFPLSKNILFPNKFTKKKCQPLHRPTKLQWSAQLQSIFAKPRELSLL